MADVDGESTAAAAAALVQMMEKVSAALQLSELFNERRRRPQPRHHSWFTAGTESMSTIYLCL